VSSSRPRAGRHRPARTGMAASVRRFLSRLRRVTKRRRAARRRSLHRRSGHHQPTMNHGLLTPKSVAPTPSPQWPTPDYAPETHPADPGQPGGHGQPRRWSSAAARVAGGTGRLRPSGWHCGLGRSDELDQAGRLRRPGGLEISTLRVWSILVSHRTDHVSTRAARVELYSSYFSNRFSYAGSQGDMQ